MIRWRWMIALCAFLSMGILSAYAQETDTLSSLWEQVEDQPDDFSVGCAVMTDYSLDNWVLYNADQQFPLASVSKLLIFIEYARRVDSGEIDLTEMVAVSTLERYNLPRTDRGAHDRFMAQYPANIQSISLWDLAVGMIQYSSNAASDYILDRLHPVDWDSLYQVLFITNTGYPHSLTLIPLLMDNHETGQPTMSEVPSLSTMQGERYLELYVEDETWRQDEINYRSRRRNLFPAWNIQAAILEQHTVTGTVNDFLNILTAIYSVDGPLSSTVKNLVRNALQWNNNDFIDANYIEYGSKLGFYSGGTLTLVAYGRPFNGNPVISVAFFRNIPRSVYRQLLQEDSIGELAHWMNFNQCTGLQDMLPTAL